MQHSTITFRKPSNMHAHFRNASGGLMSDTIKYLYENYHYCVAMPNTKPSLATGRDTKDYFQYEILPLIPKEYLDSFTPLISIKVLWGNEFRTTKEVIRSAYEDGVLAAKLYIIGTTTNSDDGVLLKDLQELSPTFEAMEKLGMVLQIHGEVPDPGVDMLDREWVFGDKYTKQLVKRFPDLKIVQEHVTDRRMIELIAGLPPTVAATITTHHLYMTQNDVIEPGLRPVNACKPYAKLFKDLHAVQDAALSGSPKFFFGDDTAPHRKHDKFKDKCHCGCFHTHSTEFVTQFFMQNKHTVTALENFMSNYGPQFYGLVHGSETVTLEQVPDGYSIASEVNDILAWGADRPLLWRKK